MKVQILTYGLILGGALTFHVVCLTDVPTEPDYEPLKYYATMESGTYSQAKQTAKQFISIKYKMCYLCARTF